MAALSLYVQKIKSRISHGITGFALYAKDHERGYHLAVELISLAASIAVLVTLVLFLRDRKEQANIAAWNLLLSINEKEAAKITDAGQNFALETLAKNGIQMHDITVKGLLLSNAQLSGANFNEADFSKVQLISINLRGAEFWMANLSSASFLWCDCRDANFTEALLRNASISGGNFSNAEFAGADISDLYSCRLERYVCEWANAAYRCKRF